MDQKELCRRFCEKIKQAQLVRLKEAGHSEEEANKFWFKYRRDYLNSWKEFVEEGLVLIPEELNRVLPRVIEEFIEEGYDEQSKRVFKRDRRDGSLGN